MDRGEMSIGKMKATGGFGQDKIPESYEGYRDNVESDMEF